MLPIKIQIAPCYGDDVEVLDFYYETIELSDEVFKHSGRMITKQYQNDDTEHLGEKTEHRYHFSWLIKRNSINQVNIGFRNKMNSYEVAIYTGDNVSSYCYFKTYKEAKRVLDIIWNWVMKVEQEVKPEII